MRFDGQVGRAAAVEEVDGGDVAVAEAAALADDDSAELHTADTIAAGAGLVDTAAAKALAEGAAREVRELAALGAPFERAGQAWSLSREAAHARHRVARVKGDGAGAAIMATLIEAVRQAPHIEIRDGWKAAALLGDENRCTGALVTGPDGEAETIEAGATLLAMGGAGCISVTANVMPEACAAMHKAFAAGDFETAQTIERRLIALHKAMFCSPSPGPAKYVLHRLGLCEPDVRLPLTPPDAAAREQIDAAMALAGLHA